MADGPRRTLRDGRAERGQRGAWGTARRRPGEAGKWGCLREGAGWRIWLLLAQALLCSCTLFLSSPMASLSLPPTLTVRAAASASSSAASGSFTVPGNLKVSLRSACNRLPTARSSDIRVCRSSVLSSPLPVVSSLAPALSSRRRGSYAHRRVSLRERVLATSSR